MPVGGSGCDRLRYCRVHGWRWRRRSRLHRGTRDTDSLWRLRFRHRIACTRSAAARQYLLPSVGGGICGRLADLASVQGALHRHVCLPRDPPGHAAEARDARVDLRLEPRNADAGRARRTPRSRAAGPVQTPHRRRVEGRRQSQGVARRWISDCRDFCTGRFAAHEREGAVAMNELLRNSSDRFVSIRESVNVKSPLLARCDHAAPSIFRPENMLREARRQKGLSSAPVPPVCVLDPDGDIVDHVRRQSVATPSAHWACYHTRMWEWTSGGIHYGIIGRAVGGSFSVMVAEQLFASGCQLLISVASAGQITDIGPPPYWILIERALRD